MELDHLFFCIAPDGPEPAALEALGLRESFRRDHPGQGTANLCYCFDNAYLELLWLTDEAQARAPAIARTRLTERANWRSTGASPFGIALRGGAAEPPLPIAHWDYQPPYLPDGQSIAVAVFSDKPTQPLVFRSPGRARPDAWSDAGIGVRQHPVGLREISEVEIILPQGVEPAEDLRRLAACPWLKLAHGAGPQMILTIRRDNGPPRHLQLPDCRLLRTPSRASPTA